MSIIDLTENLKETLASYNIKVHHDLIKDLATLLNNAGIKKSFLAKFKKGLCILSEYSTKAHILSPEQFERLKDDNSLFSMHVQGKDFNIRILYSFISNDTRLLHGFYERTGKKATNYTKPIKTAGERLDDYIDG